MKICIIARNINEDYTGSFEFDQAQALSRQGHDVYVISLDFRSIRRKRKFGFHTDMHDGITVMRCSVPVGPVKTGVAERIELHAFRKAYCALEKEAAGFDIINSHFYSISYLCLRGIKEALKRDVPVIVTEHSSLLNREKESITENDYLKACYVFETADKVIAVSSALAEKIKQNFGVECEVVYNVFDGKIFNGERRQHDVDGNFTFVSAGNLLPNKRMDLLIRAFAKAFPNEERTRLYIFGDGPERERLERMVNELNLEERVFLPGRKPRSVLADFYAMADAFALVSECETFGVAYIEAMASGMPVISCRSGGPEDFVIPETGIIAGDSETDIAEAMKKMKAERDSYDDDFIRDYADRICGGKAIASQLTDIYSDLL